MKCDFVIQVSRDPVYNNNLSAIAHNIASQILQPPAAVALLADQMVQNPGAVLLPVKQQVILKPPDVIQDGVAATFKLSPPAVPLLASPQSASLSASGSVLSPAASPLVSQQNSSPPAVPLAKLQTLQPPLAVTSATSGTLLPIIDNKTGFPLPVGSHIVQKDSGDSFLMVPVAIPTQQVTQVRSNSVIFIQFTISNFLSVLSVEAL